MRSAEAPRQNVIPLRAEAPSDDALVLRACEGDPLARRLIVERYAAHVAGLLHNVIGSQGALQDLVQETFLVVFRDLPSLREPALLKAWVSRIALHRAHTFFRSRRRRRWLSYFSELDADEPALDPPAPPGASSETLQAVRAAYEVLDSMRERERLAFALRFIEAMTVQEVANALGVSLATTKRALQSAELHFRQRAARDPRLQAFLEGKTSP